MKVGSGTVTVTSMETLQAEGSITLTKGEAAAAGGKEPELRDHRGASGTALRGAGEGYPWRRDPGVRRQRETRRSQMVGREVRLPDGCSSRRTAGDPPAPG